MTHSPSAQTRKRVLLISATACALILIGGIVFTLALYARGEIADGELFRRLWYAVLCALMTAAVFLVELLLRIRFPLALEVSLMAFAVAALCGGNLYNLYGYLPFWDKILHTSSGPLFSIVGLSFGALLLKDMPAGKGKVLAVVLFAFLFSLAVGYLWEVFEYAVDSLMPGGYNNQRWQNGIVGQLENGNWEVTEPRGSGLIDTMSDLICNLIGTLLLLVPVLVLFWKKPSRAEMFALERLPRQKRNSAPDGAGETPARPEDALEPREKQDPRPSEEERE